MLEKFCDTLVEIIFSLAKRLCYAINQRTLYVDRNFFWHVMLIREKWLVAVIKEEFTNIWNISPLNAIPMYCELAQIPKAIIFRLRGKANTLSVDYVLPDYTHVKRGFVRKSNEPANKQEQVGYLLSDSVEVVCSTFESWQNSKLFDYRLYINSLSVANVIFSL